MFTATRTLPTSHGLVNIQPANRNQEASFHRTASTVLCAAYPSSNGWRQTDGLVRGIKIFISTNESVSAKRGFTLIELLVVITIIALLLTIAVPRYFGSVDRAKEAVLQENLASMRDSLDKFYADTGKYPDTLEDLISRRYLRKIPVDPMTESAETWVTIAPEDADKGGVYDVKSGAVGTARDGTPYDEW